MANHEARRPATVEAQCTRRRSSPVPVLAQPVELVTDSSEDRQRHPDIGVRLDWKIARPDGIDSRMHGERGERRNRLCRSTRVRPNGSDSSSFGGPTRTRPACPVGRVYAAQRTSPGSSGAIRKRAHRRPPSKGSWAARIGRGPPTVVGNGQLDPGHPLQQAPGRDGHAGVIRTSHTPGCRPRPGQVATRHQARAPASGYNSLIPNRKATDGAADGHAPATPTLAEVRPALPGSITRLMRP